MDVKALNIHRQMDVKLNELAKQILMLLPLLLFFSFFIFLDRHRQGVQQGRVYPLADRYATMRFLRDGSTEVELLRHIGMNGNGSIKITMGNIGA